MNWRNAVIGGAIGIPLVVFLAFGLTRDPRVLPSTLPGRPAPPFTLVTLEGRDTVSLAAQAGHVVVLNFWASWCIPCLQEHGELEAAARLFEERGVRFFGLLYQDRPDNAVAWLENLGGQTYPSLLDGQSRAAIDYGLSGVPETFVIDQAGLVAYKHIGPITAARLAEVISPLLEAGGSE